MILDATAGNRHMWGKNAENINTVFMDKEYNLKIPPDVLADFTKLPFRDNVFNCVLFDPPHHIGNIPWFDDPKENRNSRQGPWYGYGYKSRREMIPAFYKASEEFARVSKRLCFRWFERNIRLHKILTVFTSRWTIVAKTRIRGKSNFKSKGCWWVTFVSKINSCR